MNEEKNKSQTIVRDRGQKTESVTVLVKRNGETKIKDSVRATLAVAEALKGTPLPSKPKP